MADARRAVWLEDHRTLLVSDVHLGHLWVERQRGTLLPIVPEDTLDRLDVLGREYRPARWIFLGDVVHAAAQLQVLQEELRRLVRWQESENVTFVLGNHDVGLPEMLRTLGCAAPCTRLATAGPHVLVHGDATPWGCVQPHLGRGGYVFYGHEHPALVLGDGVATSARVPCFLVGPDRVVLPAFSRWAAGQVFPAEPLLSPLSTPADFDHAVAVLGERLVPVRLRGRDPTETPDHRDRRSGA